MSSVSRKCFQFEGASDDEGLPNGKLTVTFLQSCRCLGRQYAPRDTLTGSFLHGKLNGMGHYETFNSTELLIFDGLWTQGELTQGSLKYPSGTLFSGTFRNYYPVKGQLRYRDGTIYEGEMHNDRRHGQGTFTDKDKYVYVGTWERNIFQKGTLTYPIGSIFSGTFNGFYPTKGTFKYKNGSTYEGEVYNDHPHGQGCYTNVAGDTYTGLFVEGDFTKGQLNTAGGGLYVGEFHNYQPRDDCLYRGEGYSYWGQFREYSAHGQGQLKFDNTEIQFEGLFDMGRIVWGTWKNLPHKLDTKQFINRNGSEIVAEIQAQSHLSGLRKVNQSRKSKFDPH